MKIVIVGGVAGGATTAARLRRNNEKAEILMLEKGGYISYANCGLPYYIGGVIPERDKLFVQRPELFERNFNIRVRINSEVVAIDRGAKTVTIVDGATGKEYKESYDKLVLSPGAEPVKPPIPGINEDGIFTLRSVPDTDRIKEYIDTKKPRRAVIVGAGFIGLEMAENLYELGIKVTIVEMAQQVMNVVDYDIAAEVHQHLKTKNVEFYLNDGVASFAKSGDRLTLTLKSGKKIDADLVILSIGVRPDAKLAKAAGIETGATGGIKVNPYMQTSDPDIYAVGDAIEFPSPITGKPSITYLAGPANRQGRIAADNIAFGNKISYPGAIATAIAKVFDLTVASTGLPEKVLKAEGVPYLAVNTHSSSHAGYYPGAKGLSIKTLFHPETGRLYGAQIVGYEGVDKRIDLFATVLRRNGTVFDLTEIEHAYAPPYSSAKDPVSIAGYVAENVIAGKSRHLQWHQLLEMDMNTLFIIDARSPEEYTLGTIEGAVNIPHYEIRGRLAEVPKDKTVVIFCAVGLRAYLTERVLRQNGWTDLYNLSGGYKTYQIATQKQSNEDIFEKDFIGKDGGFYQTDPDAIASGAPAKIIKVDATGLQCPGPIMKLKTEMGKIAVGERILEISSDPGFARDVASWCNMTGNKLLNLEVEGGIVRALIEKEEKRAGKVPDSAGDEATLIVFSNDMDRALASFVIANGAASAGKEVTMFFTFWGLSVIKKREKVRASKDFMGRMFGSMLPKNSKGLGLSKMQFGGMGPKMMRFRMKQKHVDSLESMIDSALASGIHLVACQMSMDVMGIAKEELLEGVEIGGVASYLERASKSQVNLFI
jgi:NADPH-dependent 2,4-dienoyl-CoA reductase/sulfur reductase-like enzyme/peroxiredoxin family protein/TusA-related sulfurtransferase/rhodanese-related sulfurtransferase